MSESTRKLSGANMDIDFSNPEWGDSVCPWNEAEQTNQHKCAVKNKSICQYFRGIQYMDIVLCVYPQEKAAVMETERLIPRENDGG